MLLRRSRTRRKAATLDEVVMEGLTSRTGALAPVVGGVEGDEVDGSPDVEEGMPGISRRNGLRRESEKMDMWCIVRDRVTVDGK